MRIVVASLILSSILASCATSSVGKPASTATISPTPSETLSPTQTFTPEPTSTETPHLIPDFMNEYIEHGFESQSTDDVLYIVLDETKIHYSPLIGIVYKERIIRSWYEVDYIQSGEWKHGVVLGYVRRGGNGVNQDFSKFTPANSGSNITNPSVAWVESIDQAWTSRSQGDHTIFRCLLGLNSISEMPLQPGVELLFEGVFPVIDEKAQSVTIDGVGEVLPVTQCEIVK